MLEPYLVNIKENEYKRALTRFRVSSHDLEIEKGRYDNVQPEHRICKLCNGGKIENEYHFLLVCPVYIDIRRTYLNPYYCRWPTMNKFKNLTTSENKKETLTSSKYIFHANKLRNNIYE